MRDERKHITHEKSMAEYKKIPKIPNDLSYKYIYRSENENVLFIF